MDSIIAASLFSLSGQGLLLDSVIILFASYWEYIVVAGILGYLLWPKQTGQEKKLKAKIVGLAILSAAFARLIIVNAIRFIWFRPRPFMVEEFIPLVDHAPTASFPSGHATFFMALAVYFLLAKQKKFGWFLLVSAVLIGIARVSAGIHFPADIVAGWIIGGTISLAVWFFVTRKS